jgi:hypothetical protein
MNRWSRTAKFRKYLLYGWFLVLGFFALGLVRYIADGVHLFLLMFELSCLFTAFLLLINQDNYSGDRTERREFAGAKLSLLAFVSFIIGAVCLLGDGYSRQKTYFVKQFTPGKVVREHVTSSDEEGEHYNTIYHLETDNRSAKEVLEWVHLGIVAGTPFLIWLIAMRKWSKPKAISKSS